VRQLDQIQTKQFSRRVAVLVGGKVALLAALVGRMYYLQVVQSEKYQTLAEDNRINLRLLPPPRGRILDRFGVPLAVNRQNYHVVVVREEAVGLDAERKKDAEAAIVRLQGLGYCRSCSADAAILATTARDC